MLIGIDVGGTKTAFGLLDGTKLAERREIPTRPDRGGAALLDEVAAQAEDLAKGRTIQGIGVGIPEIVSPDGRIMSSAVIPGWNELPVHDTLRATAPTTLESDVRAAALAEATLGAGRAYADFVYLTIGTGISFCLVTDGKPRTGARGGALNVGTSTLIDGAPTLEQTASGGALVRRYNERGGTATRAQDVLTAGDDAARQVAEEAAKALGIGIALLINMLDPQAVVLGGGLGSADTWYGRRARDWAERHVHRFAAGTPVLRGELGTDAGVIGAGLAGRITEGSDPT